MDIALWALPVALAANQPAVAGSGSAAPSNAPSQATETELPFKSSANEVRHGPTNGYFSVGTPRWFLSTKSEIGFLYAKPYFSVGYGVPHWLWAGVDLNAITTTEFGQVYGGLRGTTPVFDLAFGVRDTYSYWKPFLAPRSSFVAADLHAGGPNARYLAWEGEATGIIPLPHFAFLVDYVAVWLVDKPPNQYVYDESYRAIVADDFYQVVRVAAVLRLLREDALKLGVLSELVMTTGRGEPVFRIGPAESLQITDHLDFQAVLSLCVSSPDHLGLALGAYGVAGFRYRWATGERDPKAPWWGRLIP